MYSLKDSILESLDGRDERLWPFIPEVLQDLYGLGTDAALVERMVSDYGDIPEDASFLDLGCGKGAVSHRLVFGSRRRALGVDGMPAFVQEAQERARRMGIEERCRFEVADIRDWSSEDTFDAVILGAIGPIFGVTKETLLHARRFLKQGGVVILDEAFVKEGFSCKNPVYRSRETVLGEIAEAGFCCALEATTDFAVQMAENRAMFAAIKQRANALAARLPELKELFDDYVAAQEEEFGILEDDVENVTLLLKVSL